MAKPSVLYVCRDCGATQPKWLGKCPACGGWSTLEEEVAQKSAASGARVVVPKILSLSEIDTGKTPRTPTGSGELDRVLGGGLVPGSVILLAGDPGIGKSTLVLQACRSLEKTKKVLYASGEESAEQIALRAKRLGSFGGAFLLLAETRLESLIAAVEAKSPDILVVDSIQTLATDDLPAAPGAVSQVREVASRLVSLAKSRSMSVLIIGHVTKDGALAGPRTLEHLVDVVLTFEGDKHHALRMVRAVKNRFGSTQELGLFEMADEGLRDADPTQASLMPDRGGDMSGSVFSVVMEGTRPLGVEIQALVTPTHFGTPQRSSTGLDPWRLSLLYAVLEKRCGLSLYNHDIFVSVAGGLRVEEPAVDLAVACAVASSLRAKALPQGWIVFGEIGLGGELRPAGLVEARLKEAARHGAKAALLPWEDAKSLERWKKCGLDIHAVRRLDEALSEIEKN